MPRRKEASTRKFQAGSTLGFVLALLVTALIGAVAYIFAFGDIAAIQYIRAAPEVPKFDKVAYDAKLAYLAHLASTTPFASDVIATTTASTTPARGPLASLWPVHAVYPLPGALLPDNRIVAYYGNFYSKGMGVLGQYPEPEMLAKLASTTAAWAAADPATPVIPAIDYIAVVAQGSATKNGKYIARMPDSQVDEALRLARSVHGIVILDVQVGLSDVQTEIPLLEHYLSMPDVHLAIDPEFAMHNGQHPGDYIGSLDAADVNFVAQYLAGLVKAHNLPPKILIVHRFTNPMVTHVPLIKPLPEVQIVMDMDGWGSPARKTNTYQEAIMRQPVQFTGFKLFYKNDLLAPSPGMMSMQQVLSLTPAPSFIQYQ